MYRANTVKNEIRQTSRRRLSDHLIKYRERKRLSREELALECNITIGHLSNIEHGKTSITLDVLDKISQGTGIPVADLLSE